MAKTTGYGKDRCQKEYRDRHPVQNKKGSSKRPKCGCGSWINHWKVYNEYDLKTDVRCSYMGCSAPAEDGAHVVIVKVTRRAGTSLLSPKTIDPTIYIIPLCTDHNRSKFTEPFFVHVDRYLIDDQAREICKTVKYRLNSNNYVHVQAGRSRSKPKCGCSSHSQHYRIREHSSRAKCSAMPCKQNAVMGVPVKSLDKRRRFHKCTALVCRYHGQPGRQFFVKKNAKLCPTGASPECGSG